MKRVAFLVALSGLACERAHFYSLQAGQGGGGGGGTGGTCAAPALPACESQIPAGAPCDPVCQVGNCNWCSQKCSYDGAGNVACVSKGERVTDDSCTISDLSLVSQQDNCKEANICLPNSDASRSYCFKTCRTDLDCFGGACKPRRLNGSRTVSVCDPPYSQCDSSLPGSCCDPIARTGCPPERYCYLVSPSGDPATSNSRTVCEFEEGIKTKTDCSSAWECNPGWSCYAGFCRKVCDPAVLGSCGASVCSPHGKQYGLCP